MSYVQASRNTAPNRTALAIAFAVHAGVISALILMPSSVKERLIDSVVRVTFIPIEKPPEPDTPKPQTTDTKQLPDVFAPPVDKVLPRAEATVETTTVVTLDPPVREGTGTETIITKPPVHVPVFVTPSLDTRFARSFQPDYPSRLIREGTEGSVRVRVLVGADGRVKDILRLSATDDAFWLATQKHAARNWRFKPATEDGKPVESWFTLSVKFQIN